jgi:hypothetical protein
MVAGDGDDGAAVGVAEQEDRARPAICDLVERALDRSGFGRERGQRELGRGADRTPARELRDQRVEAPRAVERAVDENEMNHGDGTPLETAKYRERRPC